MILYFLSFIFGIFLLIISSDFLIENSKKLAKLLKVSGFLIGATIISYGTSFPELSIGIVSLIEGCPGISLGNIIGSNIANICLIIGIGSIIYKIKYKLKEIKENLLFLILISLFFFIFSLRGRMGIFEGAFLLILFLIFNLRWYKREKPRYFEKEEGKIVKRILLIFLSFIGIWVGGEVVVRSVSKISEILGISHEKIGLSLVAFGTSLPELLIGIVSFKKKSPEISLGTIIGSNIFNISFILGISSLFTTFLFPIETAISVLYMLLVTIIFILLLYLNKNYLEIKSGILLLIFYFIFLYILFPSISISR